jgi:hypothetical protein
LTEPFPKKVNKDTVMYGNVVQVAIPDGWTVWDRIEVNGPMSVEEFLNYFNEKYNITIISIRDEDTDDIKNIEDLDKYMIINVETKALMKSFLVKNHILY